MWVRMKQTEQPRGSSRQRGSRQTSERGSYAWAPPLPQMNLEGRLGT